MPLVETSELGTTQRVQLSPRVRLAIWERARGICVICDRRIDGVRERWIIEHIRALELGGADEPDNMGPAHAACAEAKDLRRGLVRKRVRVIGEALVLYHLPSVRPNRFHE